MDQIHVTLPDGSVKDLPKGTTPLEIAKSISPRLADAALVAKVRATNGNKRCRQNRHLLQFRRSRKKMAACSTIFVAPSIRTSPCKSSPKKIPTPSTSSAIPLPIFSPPQ